MAFEELRRMRASVSRPSLAPVTICYRRTGHKAALPRVVISLAEEIALRIGITRGDPVTIQIGSGPDDGRLRVASGGSGSFVARKMRSRMQIDLGAFPGLGREPMAVAPCCAASDEHALIISLPEWARDLAAKQVGATSVPSPIATKEILQGASGTAREAPCAGSGRGPVSAPRGTQSAPPHNTEDVPAPPPATRSAGPTSIMDCRVVRTPGHEHIVLGGKKVTLSRLGAHLLDLLLRAGGAPVDESFLMARLWPSKAPAAGEAALAMVRGDLKKLGADGIVVHHEKGFGLRVEVTK